MGMGVVVGYGVVGVVVVVVFNKPLNNPLVLALLLVGFRVLGFMG